MTQNSSLSELYDVITRIENSQEAEDFLNDILTPQELHAIAERWQIAKHLLEEKLSQRAIQEKLGTGIATITRGSRMIKYGNGGFAHMLKKTRQ